jgi:hypothetical protein
MHIAHGKLPTESSVCVEIVSTYLGLRSGWPSLQRAYRNMHAFGHVAGVSGEEARLRTRHVNPARITSPW